MATNHSALGDALQAWRARLSPTAAGIPSGRRRRVPGLRREELAGLAGVSIDYLIRLEQGRASNPTLDTLAELAGALRLNVQEREMLFRIAGSLPPSAGTVPNQVPKGVQQLVDRLADAPVAIFTAAWTIVQWNEMF